MPGTAAPRRCQRVTSVPGTEDVFEHRHFYVNTLGFEVRTEHTMDNGFGWLTVGPPTQKELEIILMEPKPGPMFDEESVAALRMLLKKGALGSGAFAVDDCQKTYAELKARGVQFAGPPRKASTASRPS